MIRNTRAFVAALAAAAIVTSTASTASAQEPIVVKFGSTTINDTVHNLMREFKTRIEQRSQGRIRVDIFPASQLGAMPRQVEGLQLGVQEMLGGPASFLVGVDRRFGVIDAPGLFGGLEHAHRTVLDPEFAAGFWMLGESKGLVGLGMYASDPTGYAFRAPVASYRDFAGKKIRVFASPLEIEIMRNLGATATPMPLSEVLPSLQQGVVDGVKAGVSIFVPFKFQTAARHVLMTYETIVCPIHLVSKSWLDRLSAEHRRMVIEEARQANQANIAFALTFDEDNHKAWVAGGGVLNKHTDQDQAAFRARVAQVGADFLKDKPAERATYELIKRVADRLK